MILEHLEVPESKKVLKSSLVGPCQMDIGANIERAQNGQSWNNKVNNIVLDYNLKYKINTQGSKFIK